jgi:hypothetical protein
MNNLTTRQEQFVEQYLLLGNASEAARVAGYSAKTARQMAAENLSKPSIVAAIRERQAHYQAELQITKQDVIAGVLSAINMAREQQNPSAMISGCVQLAKLCGFYEPEVRRVEVNTSAANLQAKFAAMSDVELIAFINA